MEFRQWRRWVRTSNMLRIGRGETKMNKMLRRVLTLGLLLSLIVAAVSLGAGSVTAAATTPATTNANLLSADTALYLDIRTDKIPDTLSFLQTTVQKALDLPIPDLMAMLNKNLSKGFGRPVTFTADIQPWLGDHVTLGIPITSAELDALSAPDAKPENMKDFGQNAVVIVSIKDDAKFDAFFKEAMTKPLADSSFTTRAETVNGAPATVYQQGKLCETTCTNLLQTKGFIALGQEKSITGLLDTLKTGKPKLSANPKFTKLMNALNPDSLAALYISPWLYLAGISAGMMRSGMPMMGMGKSAPASPDAALLPAAEATQAADGTTPDAAATAEPTGKAPAGMAKIPMTPAQMQANLATLRSMIGLLDGQAFGLRRDGKLFSADLAQAVNVQAMNKIFSDLCIAPNVMNAIKRKPYDAKLFGQIPAKALFVVNAGGLNNVYDLLTIAAKVTEKYNVTPPDTSNTPNPMNKFTLTTRRLAQLDGGFKLLFGADLRAAFLRCVNGDFSLYATYNPDSTLTKLPKGKSVPLDLTFIAETSDPANTRAFLDNINNAVKDFMKTSAAPAGTDLFTAKLRNGVEIGYGLVGKTFVISTATGLDAAVAAIKGDGVIINDPLWKSALTTTTKQPASLMYLNGSLLGEAIKAMVAQSGQSKGNKATMTSVLNLLGTQTDSSGPMSADRFSVRSIQLTLPEPLGLNQ